MAKQKRPNREPMVLPEEREFSHPRLDDRLLQQTRERILEYERTTPFFRRNLGYAFRTFLDAVTVPGKEGQEPVYRFEPEEALTWGHTIIKAAVDSQGELRAVADGSLFILASRDQEEPVAPMAGMAPDQEEQPDYPTHQPDTLSSRLLQQATERN